MEPVYVTALLLPILLSAVVVFIASAIAWMVLPHHRTDFRKLPDEEKARAALKGVAPGEYCFPHAATAADRKSPEWLAKMKEGPNAFVTVVPSGPPKMGKELTLWFIYCIVVSIFVAYVTGRALGAGSEYLKVFRIAGTVAFLAYASAHASGAIWLGHRWSRAIKDILDGLVYGLLTAGVFGWLWP